MDDLQVSIGQIKRDISELINRVAYGGERIVLTSRGKPKAALVSIEDYEKLRTLQIPNQEQMKAWMQQTQAISQRILARRNGQLIDVETLIAANRTEQEDRSEWISGSH